MKWRDVQRVFNGYGHAISKRDCKRVLKRLPRAEVVTGWSQETVLDVTAKNAPGALERLLVLKPSDDGS